MLHLAVPGDVRDLVAGARNSALSGTRSEGTRKASVSSEAWDSQEAMVQETVRKGSAPCRKLATPSFSAEHQIPCCSHQAALHLPKCAIHAGPAANSNIVTVLQPRSAGATPLCSHACLTCSYSCGAASQQHMPPRLLLVSAQSPTRLLASAELQPSASSRWLCCVTAYTAATNSATTAADAAAAAARCYLLVHQYCQPTNSPPVTVTGVP